MVILSWCAFVSYQECVVLSKVCTVFCNLNDGFTKVCVSFFWSLCAGFKFIRRFLKLVISIHTVQTSELLYIIWYNTLTFKIFKK